MGENEKCIGGVQTGAREEDEAEAKRRRDAPLR